MSSQRGLLLYQTGRHEMAEAEFRLALVNNPDDAYAHAMLGLCLLKRKDYKQATAEAEEAVRLRPDWDFPYHALAVILRERNHLKEAARAAETAIGLDPFDPDHHGLLADIRLALRDWRGALAEADEGLKADAQHTQCLNVRGMALTNLGLRREAVATIDGALARDPEDALAHANRGWTLLHAGKPRESLDHFREALRLNPEMEWAKHGIVEALKARNPIYRVMLWYFLGMARMSRRAQWGVILGGYFGYELLAALADSHPQLAPWVRPVLYAYIVFAIMTWLSYHLFNLMLRSSRFGRLVLSRQQTIASNWIGSLLLSALVLLCVFIFRAGHGAGWLVGAIVTFLMILPVAGYFGMPKGWPKIVTLIGAIALATIGLMAALAAAGAAWIPEESNLSMNLLRTFSFGILGMTFLMNALAQVRVKN